MPRTRIRAKAPLTVSTGGGQVTDGTNPAGSSLTTDSLGVIDIMFGEAVVAPGDAATFALAVTTPDSVLTPQDASQFFVIMQDVGDSAATPGATHASEVKVGASTVTAANTSGTGWTNPANAQGMSDGVNATMTGAGGLTPTRETGALTGVFASMGNPTLETQSGSVTLDFTYSLTIQSLTTGSMSLHYSLDAGQNFVTAASFTETSSGTHRATFTLAFASLGNLRFRVDASVQGSAVAASTATLDSVVATFNLTGTG